MKVQLLSRPDHSLFLHNYLKKLVAVQMLTFNVAKKGSLLHKIHPSAKLVDDEVVLLYDFIIFNQLIFRLSKSGLINPYQWEGRYAELSYGMRAKRYKPDIIHYWPLYCHQYVKKSREKTGVATVADVYSVHPNYIYEELKAEYDQYGLNIKQSYFVQDAARNIKFLEHEDNIITNSNYVKNSFLQFAPKKNIYVADYGFLGDPEALVEYDEAVRSQEANPNKILKLVYVGTVSIEKGIHYLLDAFKHINSEQIQLDIIGKVKEGQEKIFLSYSGQKGINFLGSKSNKEVKQLLKTYSVLVLPSLSDANSIAVIEGLQNALPVIITENTGNKDAVRKYNVGAIVPAADSRALVKAIEGFLDSGYRRMLSENIRKYIIEDAKYPYPLKVLDIYQYLLEISEPAKI